MTIFFPRFINWKIFLSNSDPYSTFGSYTKRQIRHSIPLLKENSYRFVIEEVDDAYIDQFFPIYENQMRSKERGVVFPVRERILQGKLQSKTYAALSLYQKDKYLGGFIFSINQKLKVISGAYKALPHQIPEHSKVNIGLVGDSHIFEYAISRGFSEVVYGRDRNIYGYYSSIGLACYKIQIGGRPFIPRDTSTQKINKFMNSLPLYTKDMLIFLGDTHETFITNALLISEKPKEELQKKFPILFSNQYFETTVVPHNEVPSVADW